MIILGNGPIKSSELNANFAEAVSRIGNPVGSIIAMPKDSWLAGYVHCHSEIGIASNGMAYTNWDSSVEWQASVELYNYIGTTYGTFSSHGYTCHRVPGINNNGAFLRGAGGNAAAIGTLQLDAAPNITGVTRTVGDNNYADGAFYSIGNDGKYAGSGSGAWVSIGFNAARSSAVYGRANEIRPINYSVYYFIKY